VRDDAVAVSRIGGTVGRSRKGMRGIMEELESIVERVRRDLHALVLLDELLELRLETLHEDCRLLESLSGGLHEAAGLLGISEVSFADLEARRHQRVITDVLSLYSAGVLRDRTAEELRAPVAD
jgi:hypothetical protein